MPHLLPGTTRPTAIAACGSAGTSAVMGVLVLFAIDDLGLGAPAFGALLLALAIGATAGGLGAPALARRRGDRTAIALTSLLSAAAFAGAAAASDPGVPVVGVLLLDVGVAAAMATGVLARAELHARAGRRLGTEGIRAFHMVVWAAIPLGALFGGLLATVVGVAAAVALGGGLPLVAAAVLTRSKGAERRRTSRHPSTRPEPSRRTIGLTQARERGPMPVRVSAAHARAAR